MMAGVVLINSDEKNIDKREEVVRIIKQRQEYVETHEDSNPILLNAEGITSNGKYIMTLKRGAFAGLKSIRPVM